jgi:hypothetical protein
VWRICLLFATVVAVEYVAVQLLAGARRSWPSLGSAGPALLVGAPDRRGRRCWRST